MGMAVGGGGGVQHDINVTPLIDVVLVLLIIFMVLTPLMQKAHQVNLPAPPDNTVVTPQQVPQNQLVISMDRDKTLSLNQETVTLAELPKKVKDIMSTKADKIAFFKCDASIRYSDAMAVMDILRGNGADRIGIITEELKREAAEAAGVPTDGLPVDGATPAAPAPAAPAVP